MQKNLTIKEITKNKKDFIDILLIGDENEKMIDKYIDKSILFALYKENNLFSICAVMQIDTDTIEIKNLATYPKYQNMGYASKLLNYIDEKYKNTVRYIILGTGENIKTINFYKKRGFFETYRIKNFFIDNYPPSDY